MLLVLCVVVLMLCGGAKTETSFSPFGEPHPSDHAACTQVTHAWELLNGLQDPVGLTYPPFHQTACRGWPLLAHIAKNVRVVAVPSGAQTTCSVGGIPCFFDIVSCGGPEAQRVVEDLVILSTFTSKDVKTGDVAVLASHTAEQVAPGVMRVQFHPPAPGVYTVVSRLHWYKDTCSHSHKQGGPYLGASEPRCAQFQKCSTPRLTPRCDERAHVPFAPATFTVSGEALPVHRQDNMPQEKRGTCTSAFGPGHWRGFVGDSPVRLKNETKLEFFRTDGCPVSHLRPRHARACLTMGTTSATKTKTPMPVILFIGDSIIRQLYVSFVGRIAGRHLNEPELKEATSTQPGVNGKMKAIPGTVITAGGVRLRFLQTWGERDTREIIPRQLANLEATTSGRVLVIANWGLMHKFRMGCNGEVHDHFSVGTTVLKAWLAANTAVTGMELVLLGPPAVLGLRNPGVTMGRGRAFFPLMQRFANESNALHAKLPGGGKLYTSVLDPFYLTHARWDATDDGFHYSGTVGGTLVSMVLQHIGCS